MNPTSASRSLTRIFFEPRIHIHHNLLCFYWDMTRLPAVYYYYLMPTLRNPVINFRYFKHDKRI